MRCAHAAAAPGEEAAATPFLAAVFEDATFAPPATPKSPPGLVAPEAARPQVQAAAAARDRLEQTRKPRRQRLSAKKQRETPVRVVVVDDEPAGCLLPSCFEETIDSEQVDVEVSRAPDESKNKLVVKVHRARRLLRGLGRRDVGAQRAQRLASVGAGTHRARGEFGHDFLFTCATRSFFCAGSFSQSLLGRRRTRWVKSWRL